MTVEIRVGNCLDLLRAMPAASVHCCITSPPYFGLRSYLPEDHPDKALEMGSEPTLPQFIGALVEVMREVRRVLRDDGVAFINMGDGFNNFRSQMGPGQAVHGRDDLRGKKPPLSGKRGNQGFKEKDLMMVPARLAIALQDDGWFLRSQMPWIKRSCMPESVTDRPTSAIEYVFLLAKSPSYFYDAEAVKQKGAIAAGVRAAKGSNVRSDLKDVNGRPPEYWEYTGTRNFRNSDLFFSSLEAPHGLLSDVDGEPLALDVNTAAFKESHFATFPVKLVEPLIRAGTSERGCCAACGAPWVRLVERKDQGWDGSRYGERAVEATGGAKSGGTARSTLGSSNGKMTGRHETTGWTPSCACRTLECSSCEGGGLGPVALAPNAPGGLAETCCEVCAGKGMLPAAPVPCTVLDPFGGAGTTGLVAQQLGRDAILLELNPEYAAMAGRRLQGDRGELPIEGVGLFAAAGQ